MEVKSKILTGEILIDIAQKGLLQHFCHSSHLFSHVLTDTSKVQENKNLLSCHSIISLIGIAKHKNSLDVDFNKTVEELIQLVLNDNNAIRESGLLLWLLSLINHSAIDKVMAYILSIDHKKILQTETMELAWLVIGLIYAYQREPTKKIDKTLKIYIELLITRFNLKTKLFVHRSKKHASWDIRYNIANFADQIYSIYAISRYIKVTSDNKFCDIAEQCADSITLMQGELGQWWWHYDSNKGTVIEKYPVYSVHQDSMAPFALMALMEVSSKDYFPALKLGVKWLSGQNELSMNMLASNDNNFINRGINRTTVLNLLRKVVTLSTKLNLPFSLPEKYNKKEYLELMNWEHSYHLGWVLYTYTKENESMWREIFKK